MNISHQLRKIVFQLDDEGRVPETQSEQVVDEAFNCLKAFIMNLNWTMAKDGQFTLDAFTTVERKQIENVFGLRNIADSTVVEKYYPEYGAALLRTPKGVQRCDLVLLGLDEWMFLGQKNSTKLDRLPHLCQAQSYMRLSCGTVGVAELPELHDEVYKELQLAKTRKGNLRSAGQNEQGHQKTPAFLFAILEQVIDRVAIYKARGGTTDVGMHTGSVPRETSWPLFLAVLEELSSKDALAKLVLHWKMTVLENFAHEVTTMVDASTTQLNECHDMRLNIVQQMVPFMQINFEAEVFHSRIRAVSEKLEQYMRSMSKLICNKYTLQENINFTSQPLTVIRPDIDQNQSNDNNYCEEEALQQMDCFPCMPKLKDQTDILWVEKLLSYLEFDTLKSCSMPRLLYSISDVENHFFVAALNLHQNQCYGLDGFSNIEKLGQAYESAAARWLTSVEATFTFKVRHKSNLLLMRWIIACMAHREAVLKHPLINDYSLPILCRDLCNVVSDERLACEALLAVVTYIRQWESKLPIFSNRPGVNDQTIQFALNYASTNSTMQNIRKTEQECAKNREQQYWTKILDMKHRVNDLINQVRSAKNKLQNLQSQMPPHPGSAPKMFDRYYNTTRRYQNYRRDKNEYDRVSNLVSSARSEVSALEKALKKARVPPPFIVNPLPATNDLAMIAIFGIFMPNEIANYSKHTFAAQAILNPMNDPAGLHTSWHGHYSKYGGHFSFKIVDCKFFPMGYALPIKVGPDDVMQITCGAQKMWYPEFSSNFISLQFGLPFINHEGKTHELYTEPLDKQSSNQQWIINYPESSASRSGSVRGNRAFEMQGMYEDFDRNSLRLFASLRSYEFIQYRNLMSCIKENSIPFNNPQVRTLILQILFQIGPIAHPTSAGLTLTNAFLWKTELYNCGHLDILAEDLSTWADTLRSTPQKHLHLFTLASIALYFAKFSANMKSVATKFANVTNAWTQIAAKQLATCSLSDKGYVDLRGKECLMYGYELFCLSNLVWDKDQVVSRICQVILLFYDGQRFLSEVNPVLEMRIKKIRSFCMVAISRRIDELLNVLSKNKNILTGAVHSIFKQSSDKLKWTSFVYSNIYPAAYFRGRDIQNSKDYLVNIVTGRILCNGLPPGRLPESVLKNAVYMRTFGSLDFEVEIAGTKYSTMRPLHGCFYQFDAKKDSVRIFEIPEDGSSKLELVDAHLSSSKWKTDLPSRILRKHSFWFDEARNVVFLRDISYTSHRVYYAVSIGEGGKCCEIPMHYATRNIQEICSAWDSYSYFVQTKSVYINVLSKFTRSAKLLEMMQSDVKDQTLTRIVIPAFSLSFEPKSDGSLHSVDHFGYKLEKIQQNQMMPQFSQYLRLTRINVKDILPDKLLIPQGTVQHADTTGFCESTTIVYDEKSLGHKYYVYDFHEHIKEWKARSVASRIFLATIFAASNCKLVDPYLQMTNGEWALELLKRCYLSRPLDDDELNHLRNMFNINGSMPSLRIICDEVLKSSKTLQFLYYSKNKPVKLASWKQAVRDANIQYLRTKRRGLPFWNEVRCGIDDLGWITPISSKPLSSKSAIFKNRKRGIYVSPNYIDHEWVSAQEQTLQKHVKLFKQASAKYPLLTLHCNSLEQYIQQKMQTSWAYRNRVGMWRLRSSQDTILRYVRKLQQDVLEKIELLSNHLKFAFTASARKDCKIIDVLSYANAGAQNTKVCDLMRGSFNAHHLELLNPFLQPASIRRAQRDIIALMRLFVFVDKLRRIEWMCIASAPQIKICEDLHSFRSWDAMAHPKWLIFEIENQLQIRPEQYQICEFLLQNPNSICQLNMGRGKSRVILPMLILQLSSSKLNDRRLIPRIYILRSLITEFEDYIQFSLSSSIMRIMVLNCPYSRDVTPCQLDAMELCHQIRTAQNSGFVQILVKEHRLSLILKTIELELSNHESAKAMKEYLKLSDVGCVNIFDESDAILSHKELLVYAVGTPRPLMDVDIRSNVIQAVLCVLHNPTTEHMQSILSDRSFFVVSKVEALGAFTQLRLLPKQNAKRIRKFVRWIFDEIVHNPPYCFLWLQNCSDEIIVSMRNAVCNASAAFDECKFGDVKINEVHKKQLLVLRGLFAYGLLTHILELRYRVDYGLDFIHGRKSKAAVPYRAADVPTERSEFSHPDKCLAVSILSYYYHGLSKDQFDLAMRKLLQLGVSAQNFIYDSWFKAIDGPSLISADVKYKAIDSFQKVDMTNSDLVQMLYKAYRICRPTIQFWMEHFLLQDMQQYPQKISSSSWNLPSGPSMGFSGTKDLACLLPQQVHESASISAELSSTDAHMLEQLMSAEIKRVQHKRDHPVWQTILNHAIKDKVDAIIDAGALMAGVSNSAAAIYLVEHEEFQSLGFSGIQYFETESKKLKSSNIHGQWIILDSKTRLAMDRNSSAKRDCDTFILFDDARCRGADKKLKTNAKAALTLGVKMPKDKLMQGAGRLRQLGHDQTVLLYCPDTVFHALPNGLSMESIMTWIFQNTSTAIANGLPMWAEQGFYYHANLRDSAFAVQDEIDALEILYNNECSLKSIQHIVSSKLKQYNAGNEKLPADESILSVSAKFGATIEVATANCAEECEREVTAVREKEQEQEVEHIQVNAHLEEWWNYSTISAASSVHDLNSILTFPLTKAIATYISHDYLSKVQWESNKDRPLIYVTRNFMQTTTFQHQDSYLRQVDFMLFFRDNTCLLLSDREADGILSTMVHSNTAYKFENVLLVNRCRLPLVHNPKHISCSIGQVSVLNQKTLWQRLGIKLYNGDTAYALNDIDGNDRRNILKSMLKDPKARYGIENFIYSIGKKGSFDFSDVAMICNIEV